MIMKRISGVEVDEFFARQLAEWPMAKTNFAALNSVQVKTVQTGDYTIKVQFNPRPYSLQCRKDRCGVAQGAQVLSVRRKSTVGAAMACLG